MTASIAALQTCLEKEAELMSRFLAVLRDEAQVLEEGAAETALAGTTARKHGVADALAKIALERNALLEAQGYEHDAPGLVAAVQAHPRLANAHRRLLDVTEPARTLNEANGRVIDVFLEHNQRTLDTLRQLAGGGDVYDASGRKRPSNKGTSRNIKA